VDGFGLQTWNIALNLGHWDKLSWIKPLPVRLLSLKFCKLEGKRKACVSLFKDLPDQDK
jgi:hypothetical protein